MLRQWLVGCGFETFKIHPGRSFRIEQRVL
jgi:hypothetical protein